MNKYDARMERIWNHEPRCPKCRSKKVKTIDWTIPAVHKCKNTWCNVTFVDDPETGEKGDPQVLRGKGTAYRGYFEEPK